MKQKMINKIGIIVGFVLGTAGFLLLFKVFFLNRIPREDEAPPGMVALASIATGLVSAYLGGLLQKKYFGKKG